MQNPPPPKVQKKKIGDYFIHLDEPIGGTTFSKVYKGSKVTNDKEVYAIKVNLSKKIENS